MNAEIEIRAAQTLAGRRIFVAEDEAVIALDIEMALRDLGAEVIGPAATLPDGLADVQNAGRIDGAVIDCDLQGCSAMPLADLLAETEVPILFYTGSALADGAAEAELSKRYASAPVIRKPVSTDLLLLRLAALLT